jgi:hypothetical protein
MEIDFETVSPRGAENKEGLRDEAGAKGSPDTDKAWETMLSFIYTGS